MGDLVSIVVPVYNGERFLHENVESILRQTYKKLEIIYICDGCTDKTVDILQEYQKSENRLIVHVEEENHGAAVSRNIGKEKAKGDWIIFLDSDDLFEADMIEVMLRQAIKENADICCCFMEYFDDNPVLNRTVADERLRLYCETYPVIDVLNEQKHILQLVETSVWTKLVRKNICERECVFFQDIPNCNDLYFSYAAAIEAEKIVYVNRILLHYRSNKGRNTISTKRILQRSYIWEALNEIFSLICQKKENSDLKQSFYNKVCQNAAEQFGHIRYEDIYDELHDIYFEKWGMWNIDIQKELSYFHREVYKKMQSGDSFMDENILTAQAEKCFCMDVIGKNKYSVWGCGVLGIRFLESLDNMNSKIQHIFDSNPEKWGTCVAGKVVEKFSENWVNYMVVTTPKYYEEIKEQIGNRVGNIYNLWKEIHIYPSNR